MYPVSFIKVHIFWEGHKIFTLLLSYVVPVKSKVKISQNFVAFSEYMNFTIADVLYGRPLFTKAENHQDERKKSWFFLYLAPASLNECLSLCFLTLKMTFTPSCTIRFLRKYSHSNLPYIWFHDFFPCQLIICILPLSELSELSQRIWFSFHFWIISHQLFCLHNKSSYFLELDFANFH